MYTTTPRIQPVLRRHDPRKRKEAASTLTSRPLQNSSPWKWWMLLFGCSHCTVRLPTLQQHSTTHSMLP